MARVTPPRILAVASAVDLDFRYGCTPAWWQLWKGMYEAGVDLVVTPYRGRPVLSPWWRTAPNPTYREGESYAVMRSGLARLKGDRYLRREEDAPEESALDRLTRETIWRVVTPRWRRHLERLVERERPDAVIFFTVPLAHFRGIPTALRDRFGIPVVYYDGDVPMSLPEFGGMDTGFNYYHGGDPSEYDLVLSNSEGGLPRLLELGARRAEAVFWGADPEFFAPQPVAKEMDVFFYGYGDKFRQEWTASMVGEPSRAAPEIDFALGGRDFRGDTGNARVIGDVPFNVFARTISAARINLNVTRRTHATVPLSSTCRPFELASAGAAIVSNPHDGIEQWFEPGSEIVIVEDADAGTVGLPGAPRGSCAGGGDGCACPRASPRRAHLRAPRATRARPARARERGGGDDRRAYRRHRSRVQRGRSDRRRRRRDPGDGRRLRRGRDRRRLARRDGRDRARPRRRRRHVAVQHRASGARSRPGSSTRSSAATRPPCGSTATGSTILRSSRSSSGRSGAVRPTSSPVRGSSRGAATTVRLLRAGSGSSGSPASSRSSRGSA